MSKLMTLALAFAVSFFQTAYADEAAVSVEIDVSEAPQLKKWAEDARGLIIEWHPRMTNLLPSKGFQPAQKITLRIRSSYQGVAMTSGTEITIASKWIEDHPDDTGVVIHELVHVLQAYSNADPGWLTEGIADYLRWAIYEGKRQSWFTVPKVKQGYQEGYRTAAGFLLWLESDAAPGIVNKLNAAMRQDRYSDEIFHQATGKTLDELWDSYVSEK